MESMLSPGFYGKLPVLGDFVSRRVDRDFINGWDEWLQSSIACSKEALGEQWLESYLTSPIWRFVISPGVCGSQAMAGVMMPSVDRVGRYFPLMITVNIQDIDSVAIFGSKTEHWFEEVESIALAALEEDLSVNQIDDMLKEVNSDCWRNKSIVKMGQGNDAGMVSNKKAFFLRAQRSETMLNDQLIGLNNCLVNYYFRGYTFWQTSGSAGMDPSLLVCEGMPPVNAYTGLVTGQMPERGWNLQSKMLITETVRQSEPESKKEHEDSLLDLEPPGAHHRPLWNSQSAIHCGKRRQLNEDALLDRPEKGLWVVADGMGGHQAGDVASQMIVDAIDQEIFPNDDLQYSIEQIKACLNRVNQQLRQLAIERYDNQIVGSTVVALVAGPGSLACIWAGDSRLYRLRDRQLQQITVDHCEDDNEADELLNMTMQGVKSNNVITRAIGAFDELELDCLEVDFQTGDKFMLCSDGVDKELSPVEIEHILNEIHHDYADAIMQSVLDKEARDNVSVIIIDVRLDDPC